MLEKSQIPDHGEIEVIDLDEEKKLDKKICPLCNNVCVRSLDTILLLKCTHCDILYKQYTGYTRFYASKC